MALVAIAGPAMNLLLSTVFIFLYYVLRFFVPSGAFIDALAQFLAITAMLSTGFAVFNLIPLPPLDGSKILAALLSDRARYKFYQYQNMLSMIGMLLIVSGALTGPLNVLENAVYGGVSWLAALPFRLAGVL